MIGQNLSLWGVWLYLSVSVMSLWLLIRIFTKFWTTESSELFFQLILNYGVHFCGVKKPLLYSSWVATIVSCTFHWQMVPFHIPSLQLFSIPFNLQSDQQGSCQRICVLIMRITSKTKDQRAWEKTKTWQSKAGLILTIIFW